jgi:cell division protein ZapE
VKGRTLRVPEAAQGVARFSFADLCAQPLGALDYLRIAHAFHTVLISDVPVLTPPRRNEARRFINLIDALYDNRVGLVVSADAEPDELYVSGDGSDLFERTASRLIEMRSEAYLHEREERGTVTVVSGAEEAHPLR